VRTNLIEYKKVERNSLHSTFQLMIN